MKLWSRNKEGEPSETPARLDTPMSASPTSPVAAPQDRLQTPGPEASITAAPRTEPDPPSSISGVKSTEAKLFEAMDQTAEMLLARLVNNETDETGKPVISDKQKETTFRLVMDWLAKSKRLRPDDKELPMSVEAMRELIAEAKPRRGRPPTKRESQKGEGSALAKALGTHQ